MTQDLSEESQRAMREGLTEEQLAVFDILTKPGPDLTDAERTKVKKVSKTLLKTLQEEKLVLDWREKPQACGAVKQSIKTIFDHGLPKIYNNPLYETKCIATFDHIFTNYKGSEKPSRRSLEEISVHCSWTLAQ